MKYAVVTFGCRVNQADSLAIEGAFLARGDVAVPPDEADVVVVNTCSVTATADQGARQTIRRVARSNPAARILVTGCYATRRPADLAELPNVAHVVPNNRKDELVDALIPRDMPTAERYNGGDGPCGAALAPGVAGRTAFTLRVQTGCDERCSYCIIPSTRGRGRSSTPDQVCRDVDAAVAAGYREVILTGVHLGSYGRDLETGHSLADLLRLLSEREDEVLFRVSSLEPMDCTPELVELAGMSSRIAPHFHLPLQHGSNAMLSAMRRPYTAEYYASLVERITMRMPYASIGSDVIAGFPGEGQADFEESAALLRALPLSHLHVFPYSDRPGTEASALHPKVDGAATRERASVLREIGAEMSRRFRSSQRGTTRRALVMDVGWSCVTDNYLKVRLNDRAERNTWTRVVVD